MSKNNLFLNKTSFYLFSQDKEKAEIDSLIKKNKSKWELEIEQAFERLKKVQLCNKF